MNNRRHGQELGALPARAGFTRSDPLAAFEFSVCSYPGGLFCRTVNEKKRRIEAASTEGWCYPSSDEGEVVGIEMSCMIQEQGQIRA